MQPAEVYTGRPIATGSTLARGGKEKIMNEIEVEKSSGNVFADLELPLPEEHLAKAELARNIGRILAHRRLTQAAAAELLGVDQSKVSAIMNGRLNVFPMERLLTFLLALDRDIEIRVKKKPRNRIAAHLNVVIGQDVP